MIILPQNRALQKGNLTNLTGSGGTLPSGTYRNISGTFSAVGSENTEVICQNFQATISNTGFSLNTLYQSIRPTIPGLSSQSYNTIPLLTLRAGDDGQSGSVGSGGSGAAGGGTTAAGSGGRGGSGGTGSTGKNWNEQTNSVTDFGVGGSGGTGFFGNSGESVVNGANGSASDASVTGIIVSNEFDTGIVCYFSSIIYAKGIYVGVSSGNSATKIATSSDGLTWTARTSPNNSIWYSIAYGKGIFVAVGVSQVAYSADGINWTAVSTVTQTWLNVTYGNGIFVAVSSNGTTTRVIRSLDGITWSQFGISNNTNTADWSAITYGNGLFVAVSYGSSGVTDRIMISSDGLTWAMRTASASLTNIVIYTVTYGNGIFVIAGGNGDNNLITSTDGVTWTVRPSVLITHSAHYVIYSNGVFISFSSSTVYYSTNGIVWTNFYIPPSNKFFYPAFFNGKFIAVSRSTTVNSTAITLIPSISGFFGIGGLTLNKLTDTWLTTTGIASNTYSSNIVYGNSFFLRISATGTNKANKSTDGITWTSSAISAWSNTSTNASLSFGSVNSTNYFFGVNQTQSIIRSTDGVTWTSYSMPANFTASDSCIGKNILLIGGSNSVNTTQTILRSTDGSTFTNITTPSSKTVIGLLYGKGLFIAFLNPSSSSDFATIMVSTDGITWIMETSALSAYFYEKGLAYGNGTFLAAGTAVSNGANVLMTSTDGMTWTSRTLPIATNNLWTVAGFGNGIFFLINNTSVATETERIAHSTNGITWTKKTVTANTINTVSSIGYGNGTAVVTGDSGTSLGLYSNRTAAIGGAGGGGGGGGGGGQSVFTRYSYPSWIQQNLDAFKGSAWHGNGGSGASGYVLASGGTAGSTGAIPSPSWPMTNSRSGTGGPAGLVSPISDATAGGNGGTLTMGGPFSMPSSDTPGSLGPTPDTAVYSGAGVAGTNSSKALPATGTTVGSNGNTGGSGGNGSAPSAGAGGGGRGADGQNGSLQSLGANGGLGGNGGSGGLGGKPARSLILYVHNKVSGSITVFGNTGNAGSGGTTGGIGESLTHPNGTAYTGASGGTGGTGGTGGQGSAGRITLIGRAPLFTNNPSFTRSSTPHGVKANLISSGTGLNSSGATWSSFAIISNGTVGNTGLPGDSGEGGYISELSADQDVFYILNQ